MFDIHDYGGFISAIILFQLAPGPGTLAILNATARGGRCAGMGAVFGTLSADLVHMVAAVSGLAALLTACPVFFSFLRWGGIAYLCLLGWKQLCVSPGNVSPATNPAGESRRAFRQALSVGLTNPKVIIFFLAFFPPFMTAPARPVTLVVMMTHVTLICLLYQTILVMVGDGISRKLSGVKRLRLIASRLAGTALIGFGVRLAFDSD